MTILLRCAASRCIALLVTGLASTLVSSCKCDSGATEGAAAQPSASAAPTGIGLSFEPTPEQLERVAALQANLVAGRFPNATLTKDNAELFVYLASREGEPALTAAALDAMSKTHASSDVPDKVRVGDDYAKVVGQGLGSDDRKIAFHAIEAARAAISGPRGSAAVLQSLQQLGRTTSEAVIAYDVIDALLRAHRTLPTKGNAEVYARLVTMLEPHVASSALFALSFQVGNLGEPQATKMEVLKLLDHDDPGVRGRALRVLGRFAKSQDTEEIDALLRGLEDEHPYVRSEAAVALAGTGHQAAIHALVPLLDDEAENGYVIDGFGRANGSVGNVAHRVGTLARVDDVALDAIVHLSRGELELERPSASDVQGRRDALARDKRRAKAWYMQHESRLPASKAR